MASGFHPDARIQQIAEAYSLDAVDFARNQFGLVLDWSDSSIKDIEWILATLHNDLPFVRPSSDKIMQFAKMLGSYVGEVFRKNHGGTWGVVRLNEEEFPGMETSNSATSFWPWGRAEKRINNGEEDNMWHYYKLLVDKNDKKC